MNKKQKVNSKKKSNFSPGILVLENKSIFNGIGIGYEGTAPGEVCFNTSITGYQEIISKVGAQSIKDMGKVMSELKKNYSDSIDFSKAGSMLKELLNKQ